MKLLQWNIWFKEKIENVASVINDLDPDIICLQELSYDSQFNPGIHTADYLKEKLSMHLNYQYSQKWKTFLEKEQGNAILSKYPFIKTTYNYIQEPIFDTKDFAKEGRVYVEGSIELSDKVFTFGTYHSSYTHRFDITPAKKIEVDNLVNILKTKKEKYFFTGDFNAIPNSYMIEQISNYLRNAGPSLSENTWTTKPFDYGGFKETELNWRLDYVFTTPDVQINSAKIIDTKYSDHLPILIDFEA